MKQDIKCLFGLHKYEIYKDEPLTDARENILGRIIISRCSVCGKIRVDKVRTIENY